jgi:hypothetical protein
MPGLSVSDNESDRPASCRGKHESLTDHSGAFQGLFGHRAIRVQNRNNRLTEILPGFVQSRSLGIGAGQFLYERHIAFRHFHEYSSQLHRRRQLSNQPPCLRYFASTTRPGPGAGADPLVRTRATTARAAR